MKTEASEDGIPGRLPESLKRHFRKELLDQARHDDGLGLFELSLFEFYAKENEATIERMLTEERAYVEGQIKRGVEVVNDSGIVAAEYFTRRIRYADVIYLCSLLEAFLEAACSRLVCVLDRPDVQFVAGRGGGKWKRCQEFLEKHGGFSMPDIQSGPLRVLWSVRNCIVHDNGDVSGLTDAEQQSLQASVGLKIDNHVVDIERGFIEGSFAAFRGLVDNINESLRSVIDAQIGKEG